MRTTADALRSLKRYVAATLGPEWEVRLPADDDVFHRPFCRVRTTTPGTIRMAGSLQVEYRQSFSILCYPIEQNDEEQARLEAARVEERLFQAIAVGTHAPSLGQQVSLTTRRGHPMRIPLYDYDGVPVTEAVSEEARDHRDFMRVEGEPTITTLTDPQDPLSVVVTAEIRMSWVRSAAVPSAVMPVQSVTVEESP